MEKVKALILFSGGLDSRLVVKVLQEQGIVPICAIFKLPFSELSSNKESSNLEFLKQQKVETHIIDCTTGELLRQYLEIIKNPKYGRGRVMNPCIDCRIFILKYAKQLLKKYDCQFIATGEVVGERPMSQQKNSMNIIEIESELENQILRPLSAKLLEETTAEKNKLINRNRLFNIQGRKRDRQIALAKKYNIDFPTPAGGCLLCEKNYVNKLKDLFNNTKTSEIIYQNIALLKGFRHFRAKGKIILGKNHQENKTLEEMNKIFRWNILIPEKPGPTAIFENEDDKELVQQLIESHSIKDVDKRKQFNKIKIS